MKKLQSRNTLVIEMNLYKPIGTEEIGKNRVTKYLREVENLLNLRLLAEPLSHISPLYGLSAWVVGKPHEARTATGIHFYAWDRLDPSPFLSVDFSLPNQLSPELQDAIIKLTADYFGGKESEIVYKTSSDPHGPFWREIAGDIIRQRLAVAASFQDNIANLVVTSFLEELAEQLAMRKLSDAILNGQNAWMHWETSGVMLSWNNTTKEIYFDIYTCKRFSPDKAISFIREKFNNLLEVTHKNY